MLNNSGTKLFLIILASASGLLLILMVLLVVLGRKQPKGKGLKALKPITLIMVLAVTALSIVTSLTYHNVTGINLKYGYFSSEDGSNTTLHVHRHSLSRSRNGEREGKDVIYTLENDTLSFRLDGVDYSYEVRDFGTKLYKDDALVYKYMNN